MSKLEITIKTTVSQTAYKADTDGMEEIYLRAVVTQAKDLIELVGRGKFEVVVTYDRPTKNRRSSKRRLKQKGA